MKPFIKRKRHLLRISQMKKPPPRILPWAGTFIEGLFKDLKEDLKMDILGFVALVITLRSKYNFSVSSWGRTVARNKAVGGVEGSNHLLWLGMDILLEPMVKNIDFEADSGKIGLQALFEKDHYHLQPK